MMKKERIYLGSVTPEIKPKESDDWSEFVWIVVTDVDKGKDASIFVCETQWQAQVLAELIQIKAILSGREKETFTYNIEWDKPKEDIYIHIDQVMMEFFPNTYTDALHEEMMKKPGEYGKWVAEQLLNKLKEALKKDDGGTPSKG